MAELHVTSESLRHGDPMPARHALGARISPTPELVRPPRSDAVDRGDLRGPRRPSGTFVHWVGWGIDPEAGRLGEGESAPREGRNDFGKTGYDGPSPPPGHGKHRYYFRVYALDTEPELEPAASKEELEAAIKGHVLAAGELMGTYER